MPRSQGGASTSGQRRAWADVVVDDLDVLAGIVVDDRARPVSGAMVSASSGEQIGTQADGAFRLIRRHDSAAEPTRLSVRVVGAPGFAPLLTAERYTWGRTDVRLELRRNSAAVRGDTSGPRGRW